MYNAWAILAAETGTSPQELALDLVRDYPGLKRRLQRTDLFTKNIPLILAGDILQEGIDAPLLTAGQELKNNLDSLAQRLALAPRKIPAPMIAPSSEVNGFLKTRISRKMETILHRLIHDDGSGFHALYAGLKQHQDIREIQGCLGEVMDAVMTRPEAISGFLSPANMASGEGVLEDSINAAVISMAVMKRHPGRPACPETLRKDMIEVGSAALFQDFSLLVTSTPEEEVDADRHARRSAEMASSLGLPGSVVHTIRYHHRTTDEGGNPILAPGHHEMSLAERILVAVNHCINCLSRRSLGLTPQQTAYVLNALATRRHLDLDATRALSALCVGELKSILMASAIELLKRCPYQASAQPVVWDMNAAVPTKIICRNGACRGAAPYPTVIKRDFAFTSADLDIQIPAGVYSQCRTLTDILAQITSMLLAGGADH